MRLINALVFFLIANICQGATSWYYDISVSGGSNNGTSWANAWNSEASINWASISAGDTIYISGGTTTKSYPNGFTIKKDGTAANRIIIRVGQDVGHNGIVDFGTNGINHQNGNGFGYTINGHRGLNYPDPTNWMQVMQGSWTNNIGFWSHDRVGDTTTFDNPQHTTFTEGADQVLWKYYRISNFTNTFSGGVSGYDEKGVLFSGVFDPAIAITNIIFENMLLDGNSGSHFVFQGHTNTFHEGIQFRYGMIKNGGEDHFQVSAGWSIHDNVLGPIVPDDVHCDIFQVTRGWFKCYNNYILPSSHSYWRFQSLASSLAGAPYINPEIYIYNNIVAEYPNSSIFGGTLVEGLAFVHYDSNPANGGYTTWSNVFIFNNLWYWSLSNNLVTPNEVMRNPFVSWDKGDYVTNGYLKNIWYMNNVSIMRTRGNQLPSSTNINQLYPNGFVLKGYEPFTTNDVIINYNIFAGTNLNLVQDTRRLSYFDVLDDLESHTYKFANKTNWPSFLEPQKGKYQLLGIDTAALGAGSNLSAYFSYDSLNRPRVASGFWDMGPLAQETNLIVHFNFEEDFDLQPYVQDNSGTTHHGYRFGYSNSVAGSNFPNRVAATTANGTNISSYAANFNWYSDGFGTYGRSGDYLAITNKSRLTNMSAATIMVRARYKTNYNADYSQEQNASLISGGGTSVTNLGSFDLTRWDQGSHLNETRFCIRTNSNQGISQNGSEGNTWFGKAGVLIGQFPDGYIPINSTGTTTNWNHYAVTFNSGIITLYFNGAPFATNDISAVFTKITAVNWIGIGCNTHVGLNPYLDSDGEAFPNNGWFNGDMDDVMIFDRSLEQEEVAYYSDYPVTLYAGNSNGSGGGEGGGGGGTTSSGHYSKRKFFNIRLRK